MTRRGALSLAGGVDLIEMLVGVERGHATRTGGGDCLSVDVIGDVARGKYAGDACLGGVAAEAGLDDEVAAFHLQLALEELRVGRVTDGDEHARNA